MFETLKGIVQLKKNQILSYITHILLTHVIPNPQEALCKLKKYKLRYFLWNPRAFWPCIDSNATTTFKAQKRCKDIVKIFHVTSVVQPYIYEATRILFVHKENKNNKFIQQFLHKKYFHSFITLHLNYWCHMDYFNDVLTTFLGLELSSCAVVYARSESSLFVFRRWTKVLQVCNNMRMSN